jgi:Arc/MetJ-type ribon-helix-helix transcriptional regulator
MMKFVVPPDLEAIVQNRIATGAFADTEEVFRRALLSLEDEEHWSVEERVALDRKIDLALAQVAAGEMNSPDEARRKLAHLRERHLLNQS